MPKRPSISHSARPGDALHPSSKRQQLQDLRDGQLSHTECTVLRNLAANADDLITAIQRLKRCSDGIHEGHSINPELLACRQDLAALGNLMAPNLQLLTAVQNGTAATSACSEPLLSRLLIPSMAYITPWRSSEILQCLPPLPTIQNKKLEELAFTHPGFVPGSSPDKQYERLEWLGDAYLEVIATALIDRTFLHLPSGRCSQIRERLIRNTTLAAYFREYGLEARARLPTDFMNGRQPGRGSSSDKDLLKTQGDMFEAYVAAIILGDPTNGIATAIDWLKALWGRSLYEDVKKVEQSEPAADTEQTPSKRTPKEELSARIVVKGIVIRYEKTKSNKKDKNLDQKLFSVAAYLDGWGETGKFLGVGSALSVKEAGQKAAAEALQNKKMLKVYEGKKKAFLEAKEAAAQQEAAQ